MLHFRGKKIGISNLNKYKQKSNGNKCRILTYPTARAILNKSPCSVELCLRKETCDRAAAARQGGKRMKTGLRKKAILGMLLSVLVLAGCKDQKAQEFPDTPTPEYDAQNQYIFMNPQGFYEAEGFFCGTNFGDDLLRYYDKGSGISGVLCPDPACTHDTDSCGAYAADGGTSVSVYNGKLYWVGEQLEGHKTILYRSDLSGANREEVLQLDWQKVILTYQPQRYVIHRGYLYILGHSSEVNGAEVQSLESLLAVPLEGGQEPAVVYEQEVNTYYESTYRFVGNSVYLEMLTKSEDTWNIVISRYDTREKTWEPLYEEKNISASIGKMWVTETGEIYLPGIQDNQAYIWHLEAGSRKETAAWETADTDVPYLLEGIAVQSTAREEIRWLEVVSYTGEHLYSGAMFPASVPGLEKDPGVTSGNPAEDYSMIFIGGDREKLVVSLFDFLGGESNTILLDLTDNLKPTVLWRSTRDNG